MVPPGQVASPSGGTSAAALKGVRETAWDSVGVDTDDSEGRYSQHRALGYTEPPSKGGYEEAARRWRENAVRLGLVPVDEAQEPERPAEAQEEAVPGRQSTSEEKAAGDDVSDPLPHVKAESKPSDNSTGPAPAEVAKDAPARGKEPSSARSSIFGGKSSPGDREGSKLRGLGPLATLLATVQAYVESLAIYGTRFKLETPAKLIAAMVIRLVAALLVAYYPLFDGLDCSLLDTPSLSTSWRCGAIGWGITVASLTIAIPAVVALLLSLFHFHLARWFIPRGAALGTMIAALAGTLLIYALVVIVPVSPETSLLYQGARGLLFAFLTATCDSGLSVPRWLEPVTMGIYSACTLVNAVLIMVYAEKNKQVLAMRGLPGPDPGYYILALIVPAVYPVVYVACKCVLHEGLMSSQHSAEPSAKGRVTQRALLTSSIVLAVAWACAVGGASFAAIELTSMFARRSSDTLRAVGFFLLFVMSLLLIAATRAVITITGRSRDEVLRSLLPGDALGEFVRRAARDTLAGRPAGKAGAAPGAGGLITVKSGEITGPDGGYTSATAVGRRRSTAAVGVGVASGGNLTAEDGSVKGAPGRGGSVTSGRGAGFLSRQFKGREDGEMWDVYRMDEKAAVVTVAMPQMERMLTRMNSEVVVAMVHMIHSIVDLIAEMVGAIKVEARGTAFLVIKCAKGDHRMCVKKALAASEEIQMQISTATLRGILATSPDAAVCMRDVRTMVDFGDVTLAVTGIRTPVVRVFGPAVDRVMRLVGALPVGGVCASATAVSLLPDEVEEYFRRLRVQPAGARIRVQVYQLASLATFRDILQPAPAPAAPAGHTSGSGLNSAKRGRGDSRRPPLGGRVAPAVVAGLSTPIDQASGGQAPVGQGGGR